MASLESVANEIIRCQDGLTTMKLQKLVFYSNAIHLARHGKPLFAEPVEAFRDGPVVRSLWEKFRGRKVLPVTQATAERIMDRDESQSIADALRFYGHQSADWLKDQTHSEQPWIDARETPGYYKIISSDVIRDYYEPVFNDPEVEAVLASEPDDGMTSDELLAHYLG